jgi:hypothetical protein
MVLTTSYQKIATGAAQAFGYATGYLELWAKYNSQNIVDNNTSVTWKLSLVVTGGYIGDYNAGKPVVINGTTGSQTTYIGGGSYYSQDLATYTETIPHNSDGTKDASANGSVTFTAWGQTLSVSGSATLPTIPRASGIACSSPYIGDTATITIDRKGSSFTDTITYKIGSLSGTIAEKTTNTVLSLNTSSIADKIYALIPNDREIEGTITCITYNGDTQIGTSSASFNLYTKESTCKPTVSGTIVDTNSKAIALTGSANKFIKYVSKPKVTVNATANKSATIKSYSINLNDGQIQNVKEYTFPKIGSNNITVNAVDSRGYENPSNIDLTSNMINYVELHINKISLERTEEASNEVILNLDGVWFNGKFSDTKTNTLTASFQYKTSEETTWTNGGTITPTIEGNKFYASYLSLGNIFNYQNEYQFKIILSDLVATVGNSTSDIQVVAKGQEVIAIGEDSVWVYGDLFLNDEDLLDKIPSIKGTYSESSKDGYSCDYINEISKIVYSTEEIKTNKVWIDGKPIYRKTAISTTPEPNWKNIDYGFKNIDEVVRRDIHTYNSAGTKIPMNWYFSTTEYALAGINENDIAINVTSQFANQKLVITLEYTKTTD